jgi:hypothetical protein
MSIQITFDRDKADADSIIVVPGITPYIHLVKERLFGGLQLVMKAKPSAVGTCQRAGAAMPGR